MAYKTLSEVIKAVDDHGGAMTFYLWQVRDAYGAQRLGSTVRQNISDALQRQGVRHYPVSLADDQNELVRLYRAGTAVAKLIDAVLKPGSENDSVLRDAAAGDATDILNRVRELVCE